MTARRLIDYHAVFGSERKKWGIIEFIGTLEPRATIRLGGAANTIGLAFHAARL